MNTEEIRKKLGDPIYFRFDAFIKFDELSDHNKKIIIEKKYNKYISELNTEDQKIISRLNTKDILLNNSSKMQNVRKIDTLIKDTLALILLNHIESLNSKL